MCYTNQRRPRDASYEPHVVKKQKDITDIDSKIISMYAKGMTTRQISDIIKEIYGFEASEGFISDVTNKVLPKISPFVVPTSCINRSVEDIIQLLYRKRQTLYFVFFIGGTRDINRIIRILAQIKASSKTRLEDSVGNG